MEKGKRSYVSQDNKERKRNTNSTEEGTQKEGRSEEEE